jgi:hypothetical protein
MKCAFYLNSFLNDVQIVEKEVNMLDDYEDRIITMLENYILWPIVIFHLEKIVNRYVVNG